MLDIQIAVAKTNKYASRESGDTVEVVERPHGGFSVVLADGQGSGKSAKTISHLVTARAVSLVKDGVRDGAVARSVHDYLYAYRGGRVSATLVIVSVDLASRTLVFSRNSHCPIVVHRPGDSGLRLIDDPSDPIGVYAMTKPVVTEMPLEAHTYAVTYSDGVMDAGKRTGNLIDLQALTAERMRDASTSANELANALLARALELDSNRPADDMTVLVLSVLPAPTPDPSKITPLIRRMEIHIPL
jgi:serine phosphatase RsbU (regulator of sigma subunit)